jgi:hypothetical protein
MSYYPKALRACLVAVLLTMAAPAAINAAGQTPLLANPAGTTPLDSNLLQNAGFETASGDSSIPGWTVNGDVHVETFGTKPWPSQSYGTKWHGGKRYLACGTNSGLVRQTVDFDGWGTRSYALKARLGADFGGVTGAKIRVSIRITGDSSGSAYREDSRVLNITNHYLRAVVTLKVPNWGTHIEATVELMPKDGAAKCKMVADSVDLWVFRP